MYRMPPWASSLLILTTLLLVGGCSKEETLGSRGNVSANNNSELWRIPLSEIRDGGPGKDGIPSIDNPRFVKLDQADYMVSNDLVLTMKIDGQIRTYSHPVLDWHEIVNDVVGAKPIAVTYCPLTGTGTAWNRTLNGVVNEYGVSGLLYRNNLIPYDRNTNSNWSQIILACVQGELAGQAVKTYPLVEMGWTLYQKLFPNTEIISTETGISRSYGSYPYGDYRTNHSTFIFARTKTDNRLRSKERVLGVVVDERAKVYRFEEFEEGLGVIHDTFGGQELVVFGSRPDNIMMAYQAILIDGTHLTFEAVPTLEEGGVVMEDQLGNAWNVFGEAVRGPNTGENLRKATAFMGYWFAFADFFVDPEIHSN